MDLKGVVALVTGGNGGLGQRICHALAKEGAHVAVMYARSRDQAEGVASELRSHHTPPSLRAQRSNPGATARVPWIASSQGSRNDGQWSCSRSPSHFLISGLRLIAEGRRD